MVLEQSSVKQRFLKFSLKKIKIIFLAINVNSGCSYLIEEYVGNIKVPLGNVEVL